MPPVQEQQQKQQPKLGPAPASAAVDDPFENPVGYLRAHGWKSLGNPDHPSCLWYDTSRPLFDSEEKVVIEAPFLRKKPNARKGDPPLIVMDKVMVKNEDGVPVPVEQLRYTPAAEPVLMTVALKITMDREHQKLVEAARAEEKRKKKQAEREAAFA